MITEKSFFEQYSYDPDKNLLGSGGFGSVYRAYDKSNKRYVAIKIAQVKDIHGKFTLLNEVELSKKIDDHVNVARYEFGLRVKLPFPVDYAVMAYYEDGNLDMLLRNRRGQLTDREQYEIVSGLLEGLGHLHTENVIHRDLKLANILMARTKQGQWRPKIADFGLSRVVDDYNTRVENSAIGITIAYASPEQIENRPIGKNVDLWAMGVIIYRLLTGEMPFAAASNADVTSANLEISRKITQVELPEKLNTLVEPYQTIIKRCFIKDTKERVQSVDELLDILKQFKPDGYSWRMSSSKTGSNDTAPSVSSPSSFSNQPIAPPSVSKPVSTPKFEEIVEENTSLDIPATSFDDNTPELATAIEPFLGQNDHLDNVVEEGTTLLDAQSAPKMTPSVKFVAEEGETLLEVQSVPKMTPSVKPIVEESETLLEPFGGLGNALADNYIDENKTLIEPPVSKSKAVHKANNNTPSISKKGKMALGGGLLVLLLGLGICKMRQSGDANAAATTTNVTTEIPAAATTNAIPAATTTNATPVASTNLTPSVPTNTTTVAKQQTTVQGGQATQPPAGQPGQQVVAVDNNSALQEAKRLADEKEAKRLADEKEAKRLADEKEAKRLADEREAKRLADEREAKRLADEKEAKRLADEREAKRLADEEARKNAPPPDLVTKIPDILGAIKCRGCCNSLSASGVLYIRDFAVESDGSISITKNTSVSGLENGQCKKGILDAFMENFKFQPPKNGRYEYKKNLPVKYGRK